MIIELHIEPIFQEIRQKSHLEVQSIQDPQLQYYARAGLDKEEEVRRCMEQGFSQASRRCVRFLAEEYITQTEDIPSKPDTHVYDLDLSERRGRGKAEALTDALHDLVVQYALSKFYSTVNQSDLSNKHSLEALAAGKTIDELLYEKNPPIL